MFPYDYNPDSLLDRVMMKRWSFLAVFFLVFMLTYLFLVAIDFVPEPPAPEPTIVNNGALMSGPTMPLPALEQSDSLTPEKPVQIRIETLDKTIDVLNPASPAIAVLDEALLDGAVRHPDSALLGQDGNVFLLGHSSYLPQIYNRNFQAFNGIQDLEWGDTIEVTTASRVHVYRVDRVYKAVADDATVIPVSTDDRRLTLATCNSFGKVEDRFIVEAVEVSVRQK